MTPTPAKTQSKVVVKQKTPAKERYYEARGARKTATALARLFSKKSEILVNGKNYKGLMARSHLFQSAPS